MMNFDGPEVLEQFEQAFGDKPTAQQMRVLMKMLKHVRGRCRNNAALKNWLTRNFPNLRFSEVTVDGDRGTYTTIKVEDR